MAPKKSVQNEAAEAAKEAVNSANTTDTTPDQAEMEKKMQALDEQSARLAEMEKMMADKLSEISKMEAKLQVATKDLPNVAPSHRELSQVDASYIRPSITHAGNVQQRKALSGEPMATVIPFFTSPYTYAGQVFKLDKGVRTQVPLPLATKLQRINEVMFVEVTTG